MILSNALDVSLELFCAHLYVVRERVVCVLYCDVLMLHTLYAAARTTTTKKKSNIGGKKQKCGGSFRYWNWFSFILTVSHSDGLSLWRSLLATYRSFIRHTAFVCVSFACARARLFISIGKADSNIENTHCSEEKERNWSENERKMCVLARAVCVLSIRLESHAGR